MEQLIQYLIKLSISLAVVYLFYILVLRRLTFHTWNRWYLLGYTAFAFLVPFINITPVLHEEAWNDSRMVQWIPLVGNYTAPVKETPGLSWHSLLLVSLLAGILVALVRLGVQLVSYMNMRRSATLLFADRVKVFHVNRPIAPFSIGSSIFINSHQHPENELREIIRHEFIHVKQKHTIDILFAELICILNWYNPFAWLLRRSIRQNLEFIADNQVLQSGLDRKHYQYLLLKVMGTDMCSIAHPFNYASLKKRIAMMNKIKSARIHAVKFLFIVPLATVTLLAFRNGSPVTLSMNETVPFYETPQADTVPAKKAVAPKPLKEDIEVKVTATKRAAAPTARPVAPAAPSGKAAPGPGIEGEVKGAGIVSDTPKIRLRNMNGEPPLIVVDGVPLEGDPDQELQMIAPETIESISILKDKKATEIYGEKGRNGVVLVTTKKGLKGSARLKEVTVVGRRANPDDVIVTGKGVKSNNNPVVVVDKNAKIEDVVVRARKTSFNGVVDLGQMSEFPGLIIVDDKEYDNDAFRKLDLKAANIESVSILKDASAAKYGEKGAKGVIIIKTKK